MYFIYLLFVVFSEIYARFYGPFNADKAVVVLYYRTRVVCVMRLLHLHRLRFDFGFTERLS